MRHHPKAGQPKPQHGEGEMKSTDIPIEGAAAATRVIWEGDIKVLRSFDSLDEAIAFIRTLRLDRRHYVRDGRTIVWPKGFQPVVR